MRNVIISIFIILQCSLAESRAADCQSDWKLVFVAVGGNGENVVKRWTDKLPQGCCETQHGCLPENSNVAFIGKPKHHLKSKMVDRWKSLSVEKVKVEVYKNGERKAFFIFNGKKSDYKNWFTKGRLLSSSYEDLYSRGTINFFSVDGSGKRKFFINEHYGGCNKDTGWFIVLEQVTGCAWEKGGKRSPAILYGTENKKVRWQSMSYGIADYMAIYIQSKK